MISFPCIISYRNVTQGYLRWNSDRHETSRCVLPGDEFRVNVAVQFIVDIVVTDVLQGRAAGRALEALHVEVLVLDPDEYTSAGKRVDIKTRSFSPHGKNLVAKVTVKFGEAEPRLNYDRNHDACCDL